MTTPKTPDHTAVHSATKVKFCGLTRPIDIEWVNELKPDYAGFVFASSSKRYVTPEAAEKLTKLLSPDIQPVGVFVNERPRLVADLLNNGVIRLAQLHGTEDEAYIRQLRLLTDQPLIQAIRIREPEDIRTAENSTADYILLDSGQGSGKVFDWTLLSRIKRPYFLAGGLDSVTVAAALRSLHPYGVDVSSGIETEGYKDRDKMAAFLAAVHEKEDLIL